MPTSGIPLLPSNFLHYRHKYRSICLTGCYYNGGEIVQELIVIFSFDKMNGILNIANQGVYSMASG
jgi:hypothetical protein